MIYLVLFELLLAVHLASSFTNNEDLQILTNCAGTVGRNGHITSPNYPSSYDNNENCYWRVSSNTENIVMLFESFETESSYDVLKVMDVNNNLAEIGSYYGYITSNTLNTYSTNQMNITFTTDGVHTDQGFSLKIQLDIQVQTNCPVSQNWRITSPNFPSNYGNNEDCYWNILSKKSLYFKVESFSSEEGRDFLQVLDINKNLTQIGSYSGTLGTDVIVSSLSNHIRLKFTSDGYNTYQGFALNYQLRLGLQVNYNCPGTVNRNGRISSPNYPNLYGNDENCYWILSAQTGHISLKFETFETEPLKDFLRVYDMNNNSALIGSYDGALINNDVKTYSTNHMKIIFTSDHNVLKHGFSFKYQMDLMPKVTCSPDQMEIELKHYFIPNVNWQKLHLNDPQCNATYKHWGSAISLHSILGKCGSKLIELQDKMAYYNKVLIDKSKGSDVIIKDSTTLAQFHCEYDRRQNVGTSFNATKEIVRATEAGFGSFTFEMHLFKTIEYNDKYLPQDYPVPVTLGERIWLQYQVTNTAKDLVVFAEKCRATTTPNPNSVPQYPLLTDGCPEDVSMIYRYQPNTVQQFSINAFRFPSSPSSLVFLHCELLVCHRSSTSSRCSRGCASSRRRRSDEINFDDTSKKYLLSTGPLFSKRDDTGGNKKDSVPGDGIKGTNIVLIAVGAVLTVVIVGAILAFWTVKKRMNPGPAPTVNAYEGPAIINLDGTSKIPQSTEPEV